MQVFETRSKDNGFNQWNYSFGATILFCDVEMNIFGTLHADYTAYKTIERLRLNRRGDCNHQ